MGWRRGVVVDGARGVVVVCRMSVFLRGFADMIWVWRLLPDESLQQRGRARLLRTGPFNWFGTGDTDLKRGGRALAIDFDFTIYIFRIICSI
jgi:hypothetical protein